ncbi:MAG TPA: trigger factor [Candidatus Dormibacteraeota bacterium]|nr:trigger factor [Candidatus Dormibacteraeota bacterium]
MPAAPLSVRAESQGNSLVALHVDAPAEEVNAGISLALQHLARRVRVPGFRPGKAPGPMVERAVGWDAVRREALDHLVPDLYRRAVEQAAIDPVGDPDLDVGALERDQPLTFTATVTVRPTVTLGDYQSIRVAEVPAEVSDEQVDEALEDVRRAQSTLKDVQRAAAEGDVIHGTLVLQRDGERLSAEDAGERDIELDRERLVPGIVDGLVGMSAGDARSFEIMLPQDYHREELRGATVTVDAAVSSVRERELPPLDDELAKREGTTPSLDELRARYRERLGEIAQESARERYESEVLGALRDTARVDIPEVMINREVERQLADLDYRLSAMGLSLERYAELTGQTMEKLRGERRESAVARVKLDLALDALASEEGIEVDEAQVERESRRLAEGQKFDSAQRRALRTLARRDLRRRAAANRILEIARSEAPEFVQT